MDDSRWNQVGALCGIAVVILLGAASAMTGVVPKASDAPAKITSFFAEHSDDVRRAALLYGVSGIPFLWFASVVRSRLRSAGDDGELSNASFGAAVATTALVATSIAVIDSIALHVTTAEAADSHLALYYVSTSLLATAAFAIATFVGTASLAALRNAAWSPLLCWLGLLTGAVEVVAGFGLLSTRDVFFNFTYLGLGMFMVWAAITSVVLTQRRA